MTTMRRTSLSRMYLATASMVRASRVWGGVLSSTRAEDSLPMLGGVVGAARAEELSLSRRIGRRWNNTRQELEWSDLAVSRSLVKLCLFCSRSSRSCGHTSVGAALGPVGKAVCALSQRIQEDLLGRGSRMTFGRCNRLGLERLQSVQFVCSVQLYMRTCQVSRNREDLLRRVSSSGAYRCPGPSVRVQMLIWIWSYIR